MQPREYVGMLSIPTKAWTAAIQAAGSVDECCLGKYTRQRRLVIASKH